MELTIKNSNFFFHDVHDPIDNYKQVSNPDPDNQIYSMFHWLPYLK